MLLLLPHLYVCLSIVLGVSSAALKGVAVEGEGRAEEEAARPDFERYEMPLPLPTSW